MCAHLDRGGQGHGNQAGVLAGVEEAEKIGIGLGDQGHAAARLQAQAQQFARKFDGLRAQFTVGQGGVYGTAAGVEVGAGLAPGGVVERLGQRREIGSAKGQGMICRRGVEFGR